MSAPWFARHPGIQRIGYSGFLSAVWMLWKMNKSARTNQIHMKAEIIVPLKWLR